jgi:hypothetical protein
MGFTRVKKSNNFLTLPHVSAPCSIFDIKRGKRGIATGEKDCQTKFVILSIKFYNNNYTKKICQIFFQ